MGLVFTADFVVEPSNYVVRADPTLIFPRETRLAG